jgi:hypothetical protein
MDLEQAAEEEKSAQPQPAAASKKWYVNLELIIFYANY